jgi:hypothetical protein
MDTEAIRRAISNACQLEAQTHSLRTHFLRNLETLARKLVLPPDDPVDALCGFSRSYIEYVPEFIEDMARRDNASEVNAYLNMAEGFFLAPPPVAAEEPGLKALLDEAFLAQRLLEEINDRQATLAAKPLLPLDMTRANIIVHHLIGDEFAARLEILIHQCRDLLSGGVAGFLPAAEPGTGDRVSWAELPCMCRDARIDLRLPGI